MNLIKSIAGMFKISDLKIKKDKKKKESTIKDLIDYPDQFRLEMYVENEEIIVKIRKREEEGS